MCGVVWGGWVKKGQKSVMYYLNDPVVNMSFSRSQFHQHFTPAFLVQKQIDSSKNFANAIVTVFLFFE